MERPTCPECGEPADMMCALGQAYFDWRNDKWVFSGVENLENRTFICKRGHDWESEQKGE